MTIEETIELLETELKKNTDSKNDLLYGVTIRADPYEQIESENLPLVLIEADRTEFENAEQGYVVKQQHYLTATCIVLAHDEKHSSYKSAVNNLMKNTIKKMMTIVHDDIHKWKPEDLSHSEFMIGSFKVSAIVIGIQVTTYWEDL